MTKTLFFSLLVYYYIGENIAYYIIPAEEVKRGDYNTAELYISQI